MIDALVLREMHRRCNYDETMMYETACLIQQEQGRRLLGDCEEDPMEHGSKIDYYVGHWARSGFTSAVILDHITEASVRMVPSELLDDLYQHTMVLMVHKPFPLITVHDESILGSAA
jgi:hypothetical protein